MADIKTTDNVSLSADLDLREGAPLQKAGLGSLLTTGKQFFQDLDKPLDQTIVQAETGSGGGLPVHRNLCGNQRQTQLKLSVMQSYHRYCSNMSAAEMREAVSLGYALNLIPQGSLDATRDATPSFYHALASALVRYDTPALSATTLAMSRASAGNPSQDAGFMKARAKLANVLGEVTRDTSAVFVHGWGVAVKFALSGRRGSAKNGFDLE